MIASPCINVCKMQDGVCSGCHRTLAEITRWGNAADAEKLNILAALAQRRAEQEKR